MKKAMAKFRDLTLLYLKWGWPLLVADVALEMWSGRPTAPWRSFLNSAAFAWILCAPAAPLTLLLDRARRERAMARLCGLRESDERERAVTGDAARATLLLSLSLEIVLLVMSLVSVRVSWDPKVPKGEKHGLLSVGMAFSSSQHLDPFGGSAAKPDYVRLGASPVPEGAEIEMFGGFLLAPSTFPVLALLVLIQLEAFKGLALRRYQGGEA